MPFHYQVAVNTPFNNSILSYRSDKEYSVGRLVKVPLGKRIEKGCVLKELDPESLDESFDVKDIIDDYELDLNLSRDYLDFLSWCTRYYHYPLGQHIFDVLPKPLKRPRPMTHQAGLAKPFSYSLTDQQQQAIDRIKAVENQYNKFLLHGVTGAGKTSVYIELIRSALAKRKNVLLLIPEINLTPGLINSLKEHLPEKIYSYHSALTNSQRFSLWKDLNDNAPYVLVGVRSSIFLPYENLGLIIVDEEHDSSYKQEDRCTYNARDLALKLGSLHQCNVILGSATPSFESYEWAMKNKNNYIVLNQRPHELEMPDIDLVDKRNSSNTFEENYWPYEESSIKEITERIKNKEQVLIFVNKLGYASYVQCRSCGHQFICKNCSVALKYYKKTNELRCPTCSYKEPMPESCPECGNMKLLQKGFGTERLEQVLQNLLPEARIGRFDRDVIKNFKTLNETLNDFNEHKYDILIGTQMLSKGHNFKNVNYVLVMGVDSQLNFPDFRSNENAFQLITQISGRPGRFSRKGKVAIESYNPENKIFKQIKSYDLENFYKEELEIRKMLSFPPFAKMLVLYMTAKQQNIVASYANNLYGISTKIKEDHFGGVEILGVRPAQVEKRENKFTWLMLVKSTDVNELHNFINSLKKNIPKDHRVSIKLDIDPRHLY